jgi:hypothetical protein
MSRIIEGCNAISIIILFISFVVSFSGKLKPTLLLFWRKRTVLRIKCDANRHAECLDVSFPGQVSFLHGVFPLCLFMELFSSCG